MRKRIRKWRRDWLVSRVIANGEKLRRYQSARAGIDGQVWPDDAAQLDSIIDTLERRRDGLLRKLREG